MEDKTIIEGGKLMNENCMTGQEWYDRFVKALSYEEFECWDDKDIALSAAKKAAGIK